MKEKLVAIAGAGTRAMFYAKGIVERCGGHSRLVALYDLNRRRMEGFCRLIGHAVPCYTDFAALLAAGPVDTLVVCTPDHTHPELIEMAFAHGLDVVVEKPLAMDRAGLERIQAAEARSGRQATVTFNLRFTPYAAAIRQLLREKPVGRITTVNAEWFIDRTHGIEYFHRWHARLANSGGLLVHKATHHFDLLNWFLDDAPESVYALGQRLVYGDANPFYGERCSTCGHAATCWAAMKTHLDDQDLNPGSDGAIFNELYFKAESEDGYQRDRCCFARDIDIYDTMNVMIRYRSGVQVNYTENAYSPWQGYRIVFNGDAGRLEVGAVSPATRPAGYDTEDYIHIIKGATRQNVTLDRRSFKQVDTPHGGGDYALLAHLFGAGGADPLGQCAGSQAGVLSAMVGIAANESILSGRPERI